MSLCLIFLCTLLSFAITSAVAEGSHAISSCDDLQAMDTTEGNEAGDTYYLTDNIDCEGAELTPLDWDSEEGFTGEFDGNGYDLYNFSIVGVNYIGLFAKTTNAFIHDVDIYSAEITAQNYGGILAGTMLGTTVETVNVGGDVLMSSTAGGVLAGGLRNSHVNAVRSVGSVSGGHTIGGLSGEFIASDGTAILENSWSTATISSDTDGYNYGGLVGFAGNNSDSDNASLTIQNAYASGAVSETIGSSEGTGGLIGTLRTVRGESEHNVVTLVKNTYASGEVVGGTYVGGLIGRLDDDADEELENANTTLQNSFTVNNITANNAPGGVVGNIFSDNSIVFENMFYTDSSKVCVDNVDMGDNCTLETPEYFQENDTNEPMATWDFDTTDWVNVSQYPRLDHDRDGDGISTNEELAGPNGGACAWGEHLDAFDSGAAIFKNISDQYQCLWAEDGSSTIIDVTPGLLDDTNGYLFPFGVTGFTIKNLQDGPGGSVIISLIYITDIPASQLHLVKWSDEDGVVPIDDALIEDIEMDDGPAVKSTYTIVDGGAYDEDGEENGEIIDPVALAVGSPTATPTSEVAPTSTSGSLPATGNNVFPQVLLALALMTSGWFLARIRKYRLL